MNTLHPAHAMLAVAQHAVDYDLPAPLSIYRPLNRSEAVEVSVAPSDLSPWLDAMVVRDETAQPCATDLEQLRGCERVCFIGVLASERGEVPVELRAVRKIASRLLAVPA